MVRTIGYLSVRQLFSLVLFCLPTFAFAQQTSEDIDLTRAMDQCQTHRHNEPRGNGFASVFNPGWEHCPDIEKAWESSAAARAAKLKVKAEEEERQRGIELAKKLKK